MKYAGIVLGAVLVCLAATASADTVVTFPDPALEALIREKIYKPTGDILDTDLAAITSLRGDDRGISDLTGIEYCIVLKGLYFSSNKINDMVPLAGLINLTNLSLGSNQISDIGPVAGLSNLTNLSLYSNQISDIGPVAGLSNLTNLSLYSNQISDISAVAGLTKLTRLLLDSNEISNISAVAGLINLRDLWLSGNEISDIRPVAGLTNLTELWLGSTQVFDISPLAFLTKLTSLSLSWNKISDISAVAGLTNLTRLDLGRNQISDISAVAGLTNLTDLSLCSNQIFDISAVAGLTDLTRLHLDLNQIFDIGALAGLTNLTDLQLGWNYISNLYPLVANPGLGSGDAVDVQINPLPQDTICIDIPALQERGVQVRFSGTCHDTGEGEGEWPPNCAGSAELRPHSADVDGSWTISLPELMRVIQFYNSDGYHCDVAGEDGYQTGPGDTASCGRHDSDYNPPDWQIDMSEMLRVTQFYNSGSYSPAIEPGEDGYSPYGRSSEMVLTRTLFGGGVYLPSQSLEVTLNLEYTGDETITALGVEEYLPADWRFDGITSALKPDFVLLPDEIGLLQFAWFNIPALPATISYRVTVSGQFIGCKELRGHVLYRESGGGVYSQVAITPVEIVASAR